TLYTPIEGVVTHISSPYPGVNVTPAGAEFDIVNPKTIYFSASADQTDVINLKEGMEGDISFDSYPDQIFKGKLYFIGFTPETNETGTVYETRFRLEDTTMNLPIKMGMTADADLNLKEVDNVLAVPTSFLQKDSKGNYVTIKINDKKTKKYVEVGDEINGNDVIKSGLTEGEVIYD
ncbi:MAG: HlyD family efflux transporter periplasmic adaptor subunit, partial [Chloroflexi bacterium]|nr:HlyD family efflux transporter periplasmic adaptor subunit [Chloroflexota bacterium]